MIDINKKYRTRDGREVRIYVTDGRGGTAIHGAIKTCSGYWLQESWWSSGQLLTACKVTATSSKFAPATSGRRG